MIAKVVSVLALVLSVLPSVLFLFGLVGHNVVTSTALVAAIAWFVATPFWMGRKLPIDAAEVEI